MDEYLNLNRRFGLLTKYTAAELLASNVLGKRLTWEQVLGGHFSIIVGRANFGKTMEFKAKSKALRGQGQPAIYVALHKVLGEDVFEDALEIEDRDALSAWKQSGGQLTAFVDSLDEASLGTEDGIRKALRRVSKALDWPNSDVSWILSSRPAVLTEDVLAVLQGELRTTLYMATRKNSSDEAEFDTAFAEEAAAFEDESEDEQETSEAEELDTAIGDVASADATSKTENQAPSSDQIKVYALLPLDMAGAALYLGSHLDMPQPKEALSAAKQYGLGRLAEGPGGLDILAFIDPARNPPQYLTQVFERMVEAVQQQQRTDPRERRVGSPPVESLGEAIERLASASTVCQLPNIELSPKALRYRDGVLSARPLIASLLSEQSLEYLLGSRLFIDSGQYQVKFYPDELLPFLAAKRLASLVKSPEHAHRLLSNFTWCSTTGECGVYRALLPLAGWLAIFSAHCRQELLTVEPQAVAFFGDLRNPQVPVTEASTALERTIERLVLAGDSLGRSYYTLTDENYWQAAKPGTEPTLKSLFEKHSADWHARDALLDIAGHARLEVFRDAVLDTHGRDYSKLLDERLDLNYILALAREDDFLAIGAALRGKPTLPESHTARLLVELAWKALDARSIAEIAAEQFRRGRGGFSIDWALTGNVADEASDVDLYRLTRSLLLRLVNSKVGPGGKAQRYWADQKFVELVMDMLALVIKRSAVECSRAAKLCLALSRFMNLHHHGSADTVKLQTALKANKEVRLEFLRGLIHPTDKTVDGIFQAVFVYQHVYPRVDGDELDLEEPGYTELAQKWKKSAPASQRKPTKQRGHGLVVDKKSKKALLGILDGLRDASNEGALAWVAQWLSRTIQQSRHSECNFALFEQTAGDKIAMAVRNGFSTLWRSKDPTWNEDAPNSTHYITIAGLQGLHLDLADGSRLPVLSEQEIRRAIRYAQFEINGYPKWFWNLVRAHEGIAVRELGVILASAGKGQVSLDKSETLIRHLDEAPIGVQQSLANAVWDFTVANPQLPEYTSKAALTVVANTGVIDQARFEAEACRRITSAFGNEVPVLEEAPEAMDVETHNARQELEKQVHELRRQRSAAVVWGSFWLWNHPGTFSRHWEAWRTNNSLAAEEFMLALAAHLGEDRVARLKQVAEKGGVGLNTLKMLYEWVHSVVREEDDIKREDGRVYSPGERDHAQSLRDALVPAIAHAKSEQAYEILEELRQRAAGPRAKYLRHMQFMMREEQYAKKPIAQTDYLEFERSFAPHVSEYMAFAMAVETDLLTVKSQIETGEFSLRHFFNSLNFNRIRTDHDGLALEEDFQALLGNELNHTAGSRYMVTLEPILAEGTRRDVLCQIGSLRATVELKMSERWTLPNYIEALEKQLLGQYMMAPNSKIGFFVVVLQKQRTWDGPDGKPIVFDELIGILKAKAREKERDDSSVYLRVIGIDATPKEDFRAARKTNKSASTNVSAKYADGAGNTWSGRGRKPKWLKDALMSGSSLNDFHAPKFESKRTEPA